MRPIEPAAVERTLALLDGAPADPDLTHGYIDLSGEVGGGHGSTGSGTGSGTGSEAGGGGRPRGVAQTLMHTGVVPAIYERWWRPALARIAKGPFGPSMTDEYRLVRRSLDAAAGDVVLDVACGPGNFTRRLARAVGDGGLAVGIDASPTMLARAVADTREANVTYVRGDAVALPFHAAAFDAVCCTAALHLFAEPYLALDRMAELLVPGGRLAIMTSRRRDAPPLRELDGLLGVASGMRMFDRDEIAGALMSGRGLVDVHQRIIGLFQLVSARKPH